MKKSIVSLSSRGLIIFTFFFVSNIYSQCLFSPNISHYPVTPWVNAYLYFPNDTIGHFLQTRYIREQSLIPSTLDSFTIDWRMKVMNTRTMYVFGKFYDFGWYVSVDSINSNRRYVAFHTNDFNHNYRTDTIANLAFFDTTWHTYRIRFVKTYNNTILYTYRDDSLIYTYANYLMKWGESWSHCCFCVGFRYGTIFCNQPSQIQGMRNAGKYQFFNGYMDYLKIHRYDNSPTNIHDFNWSMNEGAGQIVHDSSTYLTNILTDDIEGGSHLMLGESNAPDTCDPIWFREGNHQPQFSNLNNGLCMWDEYGTVDDYWSGCYVLGVFVWNNRLIATGYFNRVNVTSFGSDKGDHVKNIASWNGNKWDSLGSGINNIGEKCVTFKDGGLVVTGAFSHAGNVNTNYIAEWKNNDWQPLGCGLDDIGLALAIWHNDLYAGGVFDNAGGNPSHKVAKWNGQRWSSLGSGISGDPDAGVWCFAEYKCQLYVGGEFDIAGGLKCNSIARWDGCTWKDVCKGVQRYDGSPGIVWAMTVFKDTLWVGGYFRTANKNLICNNIAKFDGTNWYPAGSGTSSGFEDGGEAVDNMYASCSKLYISGPFFYMDNKPVNKFCTWDGFHFCAVNNGFDIRPKDMVGYNGQLIIGGDITWADGYDFNSIVSLDLHNCGPDSSSVNKTNPQILQNFPNPFNPVTKISFNIPKTSDGGATQVKLTIYDILGREVVTLVNEKLSPGMHETKFDGSNYASGVYFYRIEVRQAGSSTVDYVDVKKMLLIK